MAVLIPAAIALAVTTTPERTLSAPTHARSHFSDYVQMFRQEAVLRLVLADLAIATSTGIANAVALFFYTGSSATIARPRVR